MKTTLSERHLQQLFRSRYGIPLTKIDERHGQSGQTPDFEYIRDNNKVFVCELKEFRIFLPSEERGWKVVHHLDGSIEATRKSNAINRIGKNIAEAHKQLQRYSEPKILLFLNYEGGLDVGDLEDVIRGYSVLFADGDRTYIDISPRRVSEGKIRSIKYKIDLYIWIDAASTRAFVEEDQIYFRSVTPEGRRIAQEYFGIRTE